MTNIYVFLFSLSQLVQYLGSLPELYENLLRERRANRMANYRCYGVLPTSFHISFPNYRVIVAIKVTVALVITGLIGGFAFDFNSTASVTVAFVMGGSTGLEGSSFSATVQVRRASAYRCFHVEPALLGR
eukprot:scaffold3195_cov321-Prasinococcus_capsulatus_cf.AAC.3